MTVGKLVDAQGAHRQWCAEPKGSPAGLGIVSATDTITYKVLTGTLRPGCIGLQM
jgi:hypothetical protein